MADKIKITILDDGTLKIETDKISGANHLNAHQFLAEMSRLAGGEITIKSKHGKLVQPQQNQNHLNQ